MFSKDLFKLDETLERIAITELNENKKRLSSDIKSLKEWVKKQKPNLIGRTDDKYLLTFLRASKHSLEKAKRKYFNYYKFRANHREFYQDRDVHNERMQHLIDLGTLVPILKPLPNGLKVYIVRHCNFDPQEYSFVDYMKLSMMYVDSCAIYDHHSVVGGMISVIDYQHMTLQHALQISPSMIKSLIEAMQNTFPVRIKQLHIINAPQIFEKIMTLVKQLSSEKFKNRYFVHASLESLHAHVPKELLPKEYNGENGTLSEHLCEFKKKMFSQRDWLLDDVKYGFSVSQNEVNHLDKNYTSEGSFRKLDID